MPIAESGDVAIYYELSGTSDGPALVFLNSLGSTFRMWNKVLPVLNKAFRIIRFDTRGHGRSSVPSGPYTTEQLGRDLFCVLDDAGIGRASLCGLSLGGLVAMWAAIHAPERVNRIVLANTAARIGTRESWTDRIAEIRATGMSALAIATLDRWFTPAYKREHPDEMEFVRGMISSIHPDGYVGSCGALRDTDLGADLPRIDSPALVITGKHDPATPPHDGRALHAQLPDSHYVELDASHFSAWERAREFAEAALAFLAPVETADE